MSKARHCRRHVIAETNQGGRPDLSEQGIDAIGDESLRRRPSRNAACARDDGDDVAVTHGDQLPQWRSGESLCKSIRHALCAGRVFHLARVD
jgi:hypothetical protein